MSKFLLLLTLSIISVGAFAGSTVCSSKELYYSDVTFDMGIMPPPGHHMGHRTIVHKGKVLVRKEKLNLGGSPVQTHLVNLNFDDMKIIATTGNMIGGSRVYRTTAELVHQPFPASEKKVIAIVPVTCEDTWAMVP